MSINGYIGLPGSGKSYSLVVDQILPACRRRDKVGNLDPRPVHTNLPLDLGRLALIHRVDTSRITLWGLDADGNSLGSGSNEDFADSFAVSGKGLAKDVHSGFVHDGSLVIFDEIHLFFNAINRRDNPNTKGMSEWSSMHRHWGCDFIWVSQSYEKVDIDIRRMTECFVYTQSQEKRFRGSGTFRRQLLMKDEITQDPDWKLPFRDEKVKIDPTIFMCYRSSDVKGSGSTKNSGFHLPPAVKKYSIFFIFAICGIVISFYFVVHMLLGAKSMTHRALSTQNAQSSLTGKMISGGSNVRDSTAKLSIDGLICVDDICDLYSNGEVVANPAQTDTSILKTGYTRMAH